MERIAIPSAPVDTDLTIVEEEIMEDDDDVHIYKCGHAHPISKEFDGILVTYKFHDVLCPMCNLHENGIVKITGP